MASRAEALRMIESVGGFTGPAHLGPADTVFMVHLQETKVTDDQLRALGALKGIQSLYLGDTQITDAGLKNVARLTNLHSLDLSRTKVTAKGLATLAPLQTLYNLDLTGTQVRESDLANLIGTKVLKTVSPFGQDVTKAWLTAGKLKAMEWATSQDGVLSLRLLVPEADIQASQPIVVLAELRNNTDKAVDVLRPFGDFYAAETGSMDIRGPKGKVWYRGPVLFYMLGPGAFSTLSAGEVIRDRLDLHVETFAGTDIPGKYEIVFTYHATTSSQRTADDFVGRSFGPLDTERFGKKNLWIGQIRSQPITVTKVAQEKPAD